MRTALTTLCGILVGPFAGYFVTFWMYSIRSHNDCMWRFGAWAMSLTVGAPIGLVTCGVIGFCVGCLLDKRAKRRGINQEIAQLDRDAPSRTKEPG